MLRNTIQLDILISTLFQYQSIDYPYKQHKNKHHLVNAMFPFDEMLLKDKVPASVETVNDGSSPLKTPFQAPRSTLISAE